MHNLNIRIILIIHLIFPHIDGIFPTSCFEVVDHFILGCDDVMFKKTSSLQLELCNLWMLGHPQYTTILSQRSVSRMPSLLLTKAEVLFFKRRVSQIEFVLCINCVDKKGREMEEKETPLDFGLPLEL